MQIYISKLLLYTLGIFFVAIIGALPPLFRKWSSRQLHLFIAFGAGIFLGAIFLHLLPDTLSEASGNAASSTLLLGFLLILLVERTLLGSHKIHCDDDCVHRHEIGSVEKPSFLSLRAKRSNLSLLLPNKLEIASPRHFRAGTWSAFGLLAMTLSTSPK